MSDLTSSGGARIIANCAAAILLILGAAALFDLVVTRFGGTGWALCRAFPFVAEILGYAGGMLIMTIGLIFWAFTGFRDGRGMALVLGGVFLSFLPLLFMDVAGVSCPVR